MSQSTTDSGPAKYSILSYYGLYCGGCRNYQGNPGEYQCLGCRIEPRLEDECPTRTCAESKGLGHCGQCKGFPCAELENFYRDGKRHHALAFDNIEMIKTIGPEKWLEEQVKKHTCSCGARLTWFETLCPECNK